MKIITEPEEMQNISLALRRAGKRIALAPTMGFLHDGHMSLVGVAQAHSDVVVLSIFVNPTQFRPGEDFDKYPRNLERDQALCETAGVDIIFCPEAPSMYPAEFSVFVDEKRLSKILCGASRSGHFRGVLTVVAKLFNLVLPDMAVFGQKDAQQARLIGQMAENLNFPVKILIAPIVRESDGLAMSSRNIYLSESERRDALCLKNALLAARRLYENGERDAGRIIARMRDIIRSAASACPDYIEIVDRDTLQKIGRIERPALAALAVYIGKTRLIDNLTLPDDGLGNLPE